MKSWLSEPSKAALRVLPQRKGLYDDEHVTAFSDG